MKTRQIVYSLILASALLWNLGILAAPLLASSGVPGSHVLYAFYQPVCHQMEGHSLHLAGHSLAVCTRCWSIYVSFLAGVLLVPLLSSRVRQSISPRLAVLLAVLPMVLDVAAGVAGLHQPTVESRLATGAVCGFAFAWALLPAALDGLSSTLLSRIHPQLRKEETHAE
jgi:uncharacterized membrane protein